jgi:hypothetical protein
MLTLSEGIKWINWRRLSSFHGAAKQPTPFNARQLDSAESVLCCSTGVGNLTYQPHAIIPLYRNQSWKVKTVVLKWMIMKGQDSWTMRRCGDWSNAVMISELKLCGRQWYCWYMLCWGLWVWLQTTRCLRYIPACTWLVRRGLRLKVPQYSYRIGNCMTVQMMTDFCFRSPLYPRS